jgi:hypothetical protein
MKWDLHLQQFQDFLLSRSEHPPVVLLFAGLFIAATSGFAFTATLRIQVEHWHQKRFVHTSIRWEKLKLWVPFLGTFLGFWLFPRASFEMLGLSPFLSWVSSTLLTGLTGAVSWSQIGKTLGQGVIRAYLDQAFKFSNS